MMVTFAVYYDTYYTGNYHLSDAEQQTNVLFICESLIENYGWTMQAVCGLLGNTQVESSHNSGAWQNYTVGSAGYGLVQWTPSTKYTDWCTLNNLQADKMESALERIEWERANNQQFTPTTEYPITFTEFTQSTDSPYNLACAFLHNYEKPLNSDQNETRGNYAQYWWDWLQTNYHPVTRTSILTMLSDTVFKTVSLKPTQQALLNNCYIGDSVKLNVDTNHGKQIGVNSYGGRFRDTKATQVVYGVSKDGYILIGNSETYKNKVNPNYVKEVIPQ
jgi:hypothetical protein